MQPSPQVPARQTWLVIFGALCATVLSYGVLVAILSQSRKLPPNPPNATLINALYVVGVAALVASVVWFQLRTAGKIGDETQVLAQPTLRVQMMEPTQFQTETIIALAIAEACSIFGLLRFILGGEAIAFVPFAVGTLLVNLLFILPRGLKYWSNLELANTQQNEETPFSS